MHTPVCSRKAWLARYLGGSFLVLLGIFVLVLIAGTMINYRLQADQPVAQVAQQPVTQVAQQPKRILIPTWTSIPTLTPVPTQTPIPTQTSTPTQVPTLTVTPLPEPVLIEYDDLARHTESNVGRHVLMRGKVIQVIEHGDEFYTLLVDVTYDGYLGRYSDGALFLYFSPAGR